MKKNVFLTLLLALCCTVGWAQFSPESGKMYAFQESDSGLYLDIQTLNINEPNAGTTTNNISLSRRPCVIYFEEGTTDGTWKMKNVNGSYVGIGTRSWNPVIGTSAHEWIITETDGFITIAKESGQYISCDNPAAGQPLYNNKSTGLQFSCEEYDNLPWFTGMLKSPSGTYLNMTASGDTKASFQSTATAFNVMMSGDAVFFEDQATEDSYLGGTHNWNVTTDMSFWTIGEPDSEGFAQIARYTDATKFIGHDQNTNAGTGIYTNVGSGVNSWLLEQSMNYTTDAQETSGKYTFVSEKLSYAGTCNKLRFTLTESGAYYSNGAKRMSFDSFVLNDADGYVVLLTEDNFSGNNNKSFAAMLDGENNIYTAGAWSNSSATDDYFEITLPEDIDLGGAFSFVFVTENTTMNAKAFSIEVMYEEIVESNYTFAIDNTTGEEINVYYDNDPIVAGAEISAGFDIDLFNADEVGGYTWDLVVDEENKTITLVYTIAEIIDNPQALVDLVNRIGGSGTADKFYFELNPSLNSKNDVFVLGNYNGEMVYVKGTSISALTTGLGWYLNHHAHINIAWNALNEKSEGEAYADLSNLPLPSEETVYTSNARYRYYLNYCTFGYSMTTWTWKRWQQEIDWMALHGINMPLQIIGLEEVWRKFLTLEENGERKYNYTDEEAKAFVAGPAFIAWWGMNNLEGWGGTADGTLNGGTWNGAGGVQDDAWYTRQSELATKILSRQRELGMEPVLPGFSGMVPTNFTTKTSIPTDANGGKWAGGFQRPRIVDPTYEGFADMATDYYNCLKEVMGESQYYSMDPFHEGGSISSGNYTEAYKAIYDAMEAAKSGSQWVIQQWQWSSNQALCVNAVPEGRLIVLDLFSDGLPKFDTYNGYDPQHAVFCAIPNFGGRSGLMGRLNNLTDNYFKFKSQYSSVKGIGAAPEAIEQTPVTYDLLFELPWMSKKPDMEEWIKQYATARYGVQNTEVQEAWNLLREGVLNYGADGIQGPVEDVWGARPNLSANPASYWGKTLNHASGTYTKARQQMLIEAVYQLLGQHENLSLTEGSTYESNYLYDIVELGGGVMADYAYYLLLGINEAKTAAGDNFASDATYQARRDAFLQLIEDVDAFKGTNLNFRLGKWTQEARDAAAEVDGATDATPDWYEFNNARTIISTWSSPNTNLRDYSYRSWQGLMKDLYLPRWKYYFDNNCTDGEYGYFEWNWAHGLTHEVGQTAVSDTRLVEGQTGYSYSREPEGDAVTSAKALLEKYIVPIQMSNSTYYAYRYLTNDLSTLLTIVANAGTTIDLTQYFGTLSGATVSGDFIDGTATDLSCVAIKADATDGNYTGTLTLADGTVLTFGVALNPGFYGVYEINYRNGEEDALVFVGYNEDTDNSNNVGYKLIATGTYVADADADGLFTIAPSGSGYSLSAQGKYLKQPTLSAWNHIMFSDNQADAGAYLIEATETEGQYKLRSTGDGINYVNDYNNLVFGNDKSNKENLSTFTLTPVETYPINISAAGMATLCLPFNVQLPDNLSAYDLAVANIEASADEADTYVATMQVVATPGETIAKGTPVILKGDEGTYNLTITMSDENAKTSLDASVLRGNFMKQDLTQSAEVVKFILTNGDNGVGFYRMTENGGTIGANKCWMEWVVPETITANTVLSLRFEEVTDIEGIEANGTQPSTQMYDLSGRRINTLQKAVSIVNNKKIYIK